MVSSASSSYAVCPSAKHRSEPCLIERRLPAVPCSGHPVLQAADVHVISECHLVVNFVSPNILPGNSYRGVHMCMRTHSWPVPCVRAVEPLLGNCTALPLCMAYFCRLTAADVSSLPSCGAGRCIQCTHPAVASRQKPGELHVLCQTCLQCTLLAKRVSASHSPPLLTSKTIQVLKVHSSAV